MIVPLDFLISSHPQGHAGCAAMRHFLSIDDADGEIKCNPSFLLNVTLPFAGICHPEPSNAGVGPARGRVVYRLEVIETFEAEGNRTITGRFQ